MTKRVTRRIARQDPNDNIARLYRRAGLVAIIGNVALLAAKGLAAWASGSSAIYADAANSGSDVAYSLLMVVGLWMSVQPADTSHPHGHARIEPLVSLAIGAMMALAGYEAARQGISAWRAGPQPILSRWALAAPVVTVAVKTGMFVLVRRIGRAVSSPAIQASARDNLSDIFTSSVALLGVGASRLALPAADPVAALLVSVWILRNAWAVLSEAIRQLTGGSASPELHHAVEQATLAVPGVRGIEQIVTEFVGPKVWVDVHVFMDDHHTLSNVHRLSHAVRAVLEAVTGVDRAFVHVEPLDAPGVSPDDIAEHIRLLIGRVTDASVHDVQVRTMAGQLYLSLHLEVAPDLPMAEAHAIADRIEELIHRELPLAAEVGVHIEPRTQSIEASPLDLDSYDAIRAAVEQAAREAPGLSGAHDLRVLRQEERLVVSGHWFCPAGASVDQAHAWADQLEARIRARVPQASEVVVHIEPEPQDGRQGTQDS